MKWPWTREPTEDAKCVLCCRGRNEPPVYLARGSSCPEDPHFADVLTSDVAQQRLLVLNAIFRNSGLIWEVQSLAAALREFDRRVRP